jgi:hypothetical protein
MVLQIGRLKQIAVFAGLALSLLAAGTAPLLGVDQVEAAKKKYPNAAIQAITFEPGTKEGHRTVVVEVENIGKKAANGFRIGLVAQDEDGDLRAPEYSLPLNLAKGETEEVSFEIGCNWLNYGAVTASTNPSPVSGEPANKTANNVLSETFGLCIKVIQI